MVRFMTATISSGLLALVVACGAPAAQDTVLVESSDPELRELASEILPDLVRRSGLELRWPVRVERRSRQQLVRYLRAKLDEELPPAEAEALEATYSLLGLVPEETDLRELLLSVYTEQVAGFYDPDSTALFVLDDQPAQNLSTLLVHELVHAVQDQTASLDSLTAPERGNDRQAAAQAVIEGHATLIMLEHFSEQMGERPVDLSSVEDFAGQVRPLLEGMRSQYPALSGAPLVVQESLLFPYLEGAVFVQRLWQEAEGRPAPFGPWLPQSTEQILEPGRFLGEPRDTPTEVVLRVEGGQDPAYENSLGALETGIMLVERGGAREAARGWDGDRYALFESEGAHSLVWVSVWDDAPARDRFVEVLDADLEGLSREVTLEAVEIGGRPAAILRVGGPPPVAVELSGGVP